jgi:hypothetical protein
LIEGQNFTNVFINKYFLLTEVHEGDDIYVKDNEGNVFCLTELHFVANLLARKKGISYDMAVRLVEIAVTLDAGFTSGYSVIIPGNFDDERRIKNGRIQRITLREVFYLLYLLEYKNPLILDSACSANLSISGDQTERHSARTAVKRQKTPFIDLNVFLITDNEDNTNFTYYDVTIFDKKCNDTIEMNEYIKSQLMCDDSQALSVIRITGTDKDNIDSFIQLYNDMGNNEDNFYFLLDVAKIAPYDEYGNINMFEYFKIVIAAQYIITNVEGCPESLAIRVLGVNYRDKDGNIDMDVNLALAQGAMVVMNSVPGCPGSLAISAISKSIDKKIENLVDATSESVGRAILLAGAALYVMNELTCTADQALKGIKKTKSADGSLNPDEAIKYLRSIFFPEGGKRIKKTMRRKRIKKTIRRIRNTQGSIKRRRK